MENQQKELQTKAIPKQTRKKADFNFMLQSKTFNSVRIQKLTMAGNIGIGRI